MARVITVDMDSTAIRLLEVDGHRVERWATTPLEPGVVADGAIANVRALAEQIKQLKKSSNIGGGEVLASVSGLFSIARIHSLPAEAQPELLHQLPAEAQEAGVGQDLRLLWQTMRIDSSGQDMLVVWANEQQVHTQTSILRSAGMAPRALEFKSLALARTVDRSEALIVNLEPSALDVVLIARDLPQVMRTIAVPERPSLEEYANQVAQALKHTLAFYNTHHEGNPLPTESPLFLAGPLALNPELRELIAERVEQPMETLAPALEFPPHLPVAEYAVNMGLALRSLMGQSPANGAVGEEALLPAIRINLVPQSRSPFRITRQRAWLLGAMAAALAIALGLFQLNASATQELASLQVDRTVLEQQINLARIELNRLTQLEAKIKDYESLYAPQGRVSAVVEAIEGVLTPGITINSYSITADTADFTATAEALDPDIAVEQAFAFVEALRGSGLFADVTYNRPSTEIQAKLVKLPEPQ